jgi:tRNA A-37 threonylcarbamoyl transferase component Bud32
MRTPVTCPQCEAELPADAPEGLCPECLLRRAVETPVADAGPTEEGRYPVRGFLPPPPADLARHFPQLEVLELVGQGGMGAVYKARQPALDRLVAVKVLPPEAARDPAFAERFTREARSLARLSHANILTLYDFGEADGLYYITMEFVAGQNLRQLLQAGALTEARALGIVLQVCDALQYAHDEGVVHRDVKPENILLDARGRVKIADFGLAKVVGLGPACLSLTGSNDVMGTVYYMAPEQLLGAHTVDHRADLYSLGVVFYEMLTGELPVGRFAPPSERAPVDARLDAIVLRALSREPEQRYQDAAAIRQEVEAVLAGGPAVPAAIPVAVRPSWPCVRFTIPEIAVTGAYAEGEMFRDETTLILEVRVVNARSFWRPSETREVRIPLGEIRVISCQTDTRPGLVAKMRAEKTEIILKVYDGAILAGLPAGKHGRGRLQVDRKDREAAEQLVEGILRSPRPAPAHKDSRPPVAHPYDIGIRLCAPAVWLLITGGIALASSVVIAIGLASMVPGGDAVAPVLVLASFGVAGPLLMLAGAVQMLRARSNRLAVAGAFAAVVPCSPFWFLTLPFGIWALVALTRPEVSLASGMAPVPAGPPPAPQPRRGRLRAWLRSFGGYFLWTFAGTGTRQRDAEEQPGTGEQNLSAIDPKE